MGVLSCRLMASRAEPGLHEYPARNTPIHCLNSAIEYIVEQYYIKM